MQSEISEAVILKTIPLNESDVLVFFLTPDRGRIKGVAKGGRRSKKRFVNCLDVFSLVRFEYSPRRTGDIFLLQSGKLQDAFVGIRKNFSAMSGASFLVELTEILFPWGVAEPEIFELLKGSLGRMAVSGSSEIEVVVFEIRAMSLGGFGIRLEACTCCGRRYHNEGRALFDAEAGGIACMGCQRESAHRPGLGPETVRVLKTIQAGPWEAIRDMDIEDNVLEELRPVLRLHRNRRLERELKTARYITV